MTFDIKFLLKLFLRRLHIFLLLALPVATFAGFLAYALPPAFSAQARLLVEAPQVPVELARSTVRVSETEVLRIIQQRVLTRANLLALSRQFGLHADQPGLSPDAIVTDMRQRLSIRLPGRNSNIVTVSFEAANPAVAADVANEVVTQVLRQNLQLRTAVTTQTLSFFEEEVERLDREIGLQSSRMLEFRESNRSALPDGQSARISRLSNREQRLTAIDREIESLRERRERLEQVFAESGRIETDPASLSPAQRELRRLEGELANALVIYTADNPRLRVLQARIRAAQESVVAEIAAGDGAVTPERLLEAQLADIDAQIEFLATERTEVETEIEALTVAIAQSPANALALASMEREMSNLRSQYDGAASRLATARVGERIEAQARGARITVLEQATAPQNATKPDRRRIAMAGLGGGIGLGLAVVALLILTNRAVLRPVDITARLGYTPFGTVPYFRTRGEVFRRRLVYGVLFLVIGAGIPAALWWVDRNYMPLDMALNMAMERTGIDRTLEMLREAQR
jgi:succinoglycan biosynthesis transport protein ExoP